MSDFYDILMAQPEDEQKGIALSLELCAIQTFTDCITPIFTKSSNEGNIQTKNVNSL